jgi:hypothetical protein
MCCLNNPEFPGYQDCIADGYKDCSTLPTWWKGDSAEITSVCDSSVSGSPQPVNKNTLNSYIAPCTGKSPYDKCQGSGYSGYCRSCMDGNLRCFPEKMCVNNYLASGSNGTCSSQSVC